MVFNPKGYFCLYYSGSWSIVLALAIVMQKSVSERFEKMSLHSSDRESSNRSAWGGKVIC